MKSPVYFILTRESSLLVCFHYRLAPPMLSLIYITMTYKVQHIVLRKEFKELKETKNLNRFHFSNFILICLLVRVSSSWKSHLNLSHHRVIEQVGLFLLYFLLLYCVSFSNVSQGIHCIIFSDINLLESQLIIRFCCRLQIMSVW